MEQDELLAKLCLGCYGCSTRPTSVEGLCTNPIEKYIYRKVFKDKPPLLTLEQCAVIDQNHPMPIQLKRMKLLNKHLKAQRQADIRYYKGIICKGG